jgi:hypothetical protein
MTDSQKDKIRKLVDLSLINITDQSKRQEEFDHTLALISAWMTKYPELECTTFSNDTIDKLIYTAEKIKVWSAKMKMLGQTGLEYSIKAIKADTWKLVFQAYRLNSKDSVNIIENLITPLRKDKKSLPDRILVMQGLTEWDLTDISYNYNPITQYYSWSPLEYFVDVADTRTQLLELRKKLLRLQFNAILSNAMRNAIKAKTRVIDLDTTNNQIYNMTDKVISKYPYIVNSLKSLLSHNLSLNNQMTPIFETAELEIMIEAFENQSLINRITRIYLAEGSEYNTEKSLCIMTGYILSDIFSISHESQRKDNLNITNFTKESNALYNKSLKKQLDYYENQMQAFIDKNKDIRNTKHKSIILNDEILDISSRYTLRIMESKTFGTPDEPEKTNTNTYTHTLELTDITH